MTDTSMTVERVLELIDAYGSEPGGWPDEERDAAAALLESQTETFADALLIARELDAALHAEILPEPSQALSEAILSAAPQPKTRSQKSGLVGGLTALIFPQGVRWPAGAAFASLVMGLVSGYAYAATGVGYDQADSAYYSAFGLDYETSWMEAE